MREGKGEPQTHDWLAHKPNWQREVWERIRHCYIYGLYIEYKSILTLLTMLLSVHLQVIYWLHCQCLCFSSGGICNYSLCAHHVLCRQRQFEVLDR